MKERTIDTLPLDGGWLCLDFINTVHDYTEDDPFDYLNSYANLLDWSEKVELLESSERKELESYALKNQEQADNTLVYLIEVREVLYEFFFAIAQNKIPDEDAQANFNTILAETMSHLQLKVVQPTDVQPQWKQRNNLKYPLHPIVKSAYDLLTSKLLERVKKCGSCGWLFLDQSKNKSRKWCSMETCGSNVKAKRYYHKNK